MGKTLDEALVNAEEALRNYVIEAEKHDEEIVAPTAIENVDTPPGCALVSIPMIRLSGRSVRANLSLDEGVAPFIDGEAARRGMTRTAYVEWMARRARKQKPAWRIQRRAHPPGSKRGRLGLTTLS